MFFNDVHSLWTSQLRKESYEYHLSDSLEMMLVHTAFVFSTDTVISHLPQ